MNAFLLLAVICQQPGEFVITAKDEFKVTAPSTQSMDIPFGNTGWSWTGDIKPHLASHGCPDWVIAYYANSPDLLRQIHDGYHEKERGGPYRMLKVTAPLTPETPKAKTAEAPVQIPTKPGWRLDCNGRRCRWVQN
jgi:hypothetical protein